MNSIEKLKEEDINSFENNDLSNEIIPEPKTIKEILIESVVNSKNFFVNNLTKKIVDSEENLSYKTKLKINDEYKVALENENLQANKLGDKLSFRTEVPSIIPLALKNIQENTLLNKKIDRLNAGSNVEILNETKPVESKQMSSLAKLQDDVVVEKISKSLNNIPEKYKINMEYPKNENLVLSLYKNQNHIAFRKNKLVNPEWHAPWKLYRVISGHTGWVRCIDVDPTNNWFVTGSNDRVIKFWDLASGRLKLSLTGHINTVRSVKVSPRHPYLFSCGEDKQVKCWDLEQNKVVRHYHGHLSGVYALAIHPTHDIIITGGRDCVARVWDMRSKQQIFLLEGHNNTICSIATQEFNPQIITGSHDSTVKLWDLTAGKCLNTLTHHKKSVRSLIFHDEEYTFISGNLYFIYL